MRIEPLADGRTRLPPGGALFRDAGALDGKYLAEHAEELPGNEQGAQGAGGWGGNGGGLTCLTIGQATRDLIVQGSNVAADTDYLGDIQIMLIRRKRFEPVLHGRCIMIRSGQ